MADISKIQLPNGTSYDIKDGRISNNDIASWNDANYLAWNDVSKELRVNKSGVYTTVLEQSDMRYNSSTNVNGFLTLADLPIYNGSVRTVT